jgi:hypothetical protein
MSDTLEAYRHSGKFNAPGLVLSLVAAAAVGFPLGLVYAYLIRWIPFIYVNFLATLGYGFVFGWMTTRILKSSHVRNTALAALCGLAAGLIALYCEWSAHIHTLFKDAPWFFRPDQIVSGMKLLYAEGSWGMRSSGNVTGIPLAIVWLIEAGIIVGFATLLPWAFVKDTPFCEKSRCWLDEEKKIDTLETFTDAAQLAALQSGDLMPLVEAKPKADNAAVFTRLLLKRSARCNSFCTLRVQDVTVSIDNEGKVKESTEDHTADLIIPASMFDLIAKFEEFKPVPGLPAA